MDAASLTLATKVTAVSMGTSMTLSQLFYSDLNFMTAISVGFFTGIAVFFLEYAHLDEEIKSETNMMKIISTLIVGVMTVMGIVGTTIYSIEAYIHTTDMDLPKVSYIFPAVLLGLAKKEVIKSFKMGLSSLGKFANKWSEK